MSALALANAINLVKDQTGVEADIIKAVQTGAGMVKAGTLQQRDLVINGVDIVRDNTGGNGMAIKDGDADRYSHGCNQRVYISDRCYSKYQ